MQPRNWLWDPAARRLAVIDFERAEPAPAVRDLVRLEYGPWDQRPDLREAFMGGYGRALTSTETKAMRCLAGLDALSGLRWGTSNHDHEVTSRARRTLDRLLAITPDDEAPRSSVPSPPGQVRPVPRFSPIEFHRRADEELE